MVTNSLRCRTIYAHLMCSMRSLNMHGNAFIHGCQIGIVNLHTPSFNLKVSS